MQSQGTDDRVEIRRIEGEELWTTLYPLTNYAFHASPPLPDRDEWLERVRGRKGVTGFAAFEDDVAVACAVSTAMTQNVRSACLPMGGVWGVATHPGVRRRGYCRRIMRLLFGAMHEAGQVVSSLYPFRESFYERLGYVAFEQLRRATFTPDRLSSLLKLDLDGDVTLMPIGEGYALYRDYLFQMQAQTHGMALFDYGDEDQAQRNRFWLAVARVAGEVVGVMLYDLRGEHVTEFKMRAITLYASTSQGRYLLLQWIARHVDQANEIEIWLASQDRPELWWVDLRPTIEPYFFAPMGRVVDVAALTGLDTGPGTLMVRITDPDCPWNEDIWCFETTAGGLDVRPAERAGCVLSIQALAALVYGVHDPGDFVYRGWGNPPPAVVTTMRAMFPQRAPHLHEMF